MTHHKYAFLKALVAFFLSIAILVALRTGNEYGYALDEPWDILAFLVSVMFFMMSFVFLLMGIVWLRRRRQFIQIFAFEPPRIGRGRYKEIEFTKPTISFLLTEMAIACADAVMKESQLIGQKVVFDSQLIGKKVEEMKTTGLEVRNCIEAFKLGVKMANAFGFDPVYAWQSYLSEERKDKLNQARAFV